MCVRPTFRSGLYELRKKKAGLKAGLCEAVRQRYGLSIPVSLILLSSVL